MKKVLLAYDGSASSKAAVLQLINLGKQINQLEVGVIHVIPETNKLWFEAVPAYADWQAQLISQAEEEVNAVCAQLANEGIVSEGMVRVGSPAITIIEEAQSQGYDTIMLGHRERDLGSVSMKIVVLSPVAVYIASNR